MEIELEAEVFAIEHERTSQVNPEVSNDLAAWFLDFKIHDDP